MIENELKKLLKLNQKDLQIYMDLLKFGTSAASTIATRTRIDRTTAYAVLKRLVKRGLITKSQKRGADHFSALDPELLEVNLQQEIEEKASQLNILKMLIPDLTLMKDQQSVRPAVQIFEGVEGVIALYEHMLRQSQTQEAFLTVEKLPKELEQYLKKTYIQNKLKRKVTSRVIISNSKKAKLYQSLDKKANRQTKIVPPESNPFETEIIIGLEEVAVIDLSSAFFGVLIRSEPIRNTMHAIFESFWRSID